MEQRPTWRGIVFFEGGPSLDGVTGHVDPWDGALQQGLLGTYSNATVIWFWMLGA